MRHGNGTEVLGAAYVSDGTGLRDLLWFRFDFGRGRTSTSSTNDTLHLAFVTVVAYFEWRSTRLEETLKSWFAREAGLIDLQVLVKRVNKVRLSPIFVTACLSESGKAFQVKGIQTLRGRPARRG
jgi:hypothetical protein